MTPLNYSCAVLGVTDLSQTGLVLVRLPLVLYCCFEASSSSFLAKISTSNLPESSSFTLSAVSRFFLKYLSKLMSHVLVAFFYELLKKKIKMANFLIVIL